MPQIKKPDDLQLIANLIRFFSYERRLLSTMEITKNSLAVILTVSLAADLSDAALGKSSAVYGHIDENGLFVRKRTARKKAITDKMVKNGSLSVNLSEILAKIGRAASPFLEKAAFLTQKGPLVKGQGAKN